MYIWRLFYLEIGFTDVQYRSRSCPADLHGKQVLISLWKIQLTAKFDTYETFAARSRHLTTFKAELEHLVH